MHARLNAIGFRADAIPEALERYKAETLPMIQSWPGYLMTFAMTQRSTGKVIMLSVLGTCAGPGGERATNRVCPEPFKLRASDRWVDVEGDA